MSPRPNDAVAVGWCRSGSGLRLHAVELLHGEPGQSEADRRSPIALCGYRPSSGRWWSGSEGAHCSRCSPLYIAWGQPPHVSVDAKIIGRDDRADWTERRTGDDFARIVEVWVQGHLAAEVIVGWDDRRARPYVTMRHVVEEVEVDDTGMWTDAHPMTTAHSGARRVEVT